MDYAVRELDLLGVQVMGCDKTGTQLPDDNRLYRNENKIHQLEKGLFVHTEIISEVTTVKSA
jgi:hypothetical protein